MNIYGPLSHRAISANNLVLSMINVNSCQVCKSRIYSIYHPISNHNKSPTYYESNGRIEFRFGFESTFKNKLLLAFQFRILNSILPKDYYS